MKLQSYYGRPKGAFCLWLVMVIVSELMLNESNQEQRIGVQAASNMPQTQIQRRVIKKYVRQRNLPNKRINCPICSSDFMSKRLTIEDPCFNPRFNLATAELELISGCPLSTTNCTTETVYFNGVLTSIKRKCGPPNSCGDSCVVAGLGLTSKTCSVCCPPFEFNTYNTDIFKPRECS